MTFLDDLFPEPAPRGHLALPYNPAGKRSPEQAERAERELREWCSEITTLRERLTFEVSARGWCYIMEQHGLSKGDFGKVAAVINKCRKRGLLPLDICAEDASRETVDGDGVFSLLERLTRAGTPEKYAQWLARRYAQELAEGEQRVMAQAEGYQSQAFWDSVDVYVEMWVEKIDLLSLFRKECQEHFVTLSNVKGWQDLNGKAELMKRMKERHGQGKRLVLLYCGDHDPVGLQIAETIHKGLKDMEQAVGWDPEPIEVDHFGLHADFIEENDLTWIDGLETSGGKDLADPKHADHNKPHVRDYIERFGARKVEANALVTRPEEGRLLCREAIERYVTPKDLKEHSRALARGRSAVRAALPAALRESLP